jgi:uridine kinase
MTIADHLGRPDRPILRHPGFWLVLVLKLVAAALFGSYFIRDLFLPFVDWFVSHGFHDPWDEFARRGAVNSFPYSVVMLVLLSAPQAVVSLVAPGLVASSESLRLLLIRLPMLGADLAIFAILCRWFETKQDKVLWIYWCSPILFFISYVHGQVDSIPSALLFVSLYFLLRPTEGRAQSATAAAAAGVFLGLGIAAKMHVILALPFLLVHLLLTHAGRARREAVASFMACAALTVGLLIVPWIDDPGYRLMVLQAGVTDRLFQIAVPIDGDLKVYVAPVAVVVLVLRYLATHRSSRDVLMVYLALAFGVLMLFVPPMPGWYYWAVPWICYFFVRHDAIGESSLWLLSVVYVVYYLLFWNLSVEQLPPGIRAFVEGLLLGDHRLESLVFTSMQGSLAIVVFWIYRVGLRNIGLDGRKAPILIGIAGDSGSGKDTLAQLIRDTLGKRNSLQTNGDDYHRWPRGHEAWSDTTQLSPKGNWMLLPVEHAEHLKKGEPVRKPLYDHDTGRFTDPMILTPRRFVLFVGLHAFALRRMRSLLDLRVYLDPDEALRRSWKIERDQRERGYAREQVLAKIAEREADSAQFVRPQRQFADWIVSHRQYPAADHPACAGSGPLVPAGVVTRHLLWNEVPIERVVDQLRAVPGLQVEWEFESDLERQALAVSGRLPAATVDAIASRLFPAVLAQIGTTVTWRDDQAGVSQLVFLALLADLLTSAGHAD